MDTSSFLKLICPKEGLKILAVPVTNPKTGKEFWKYHTFSSADIAAEAALQFDADGKTVYFAVNGYGDWYETTNKAGKVIKALRRAENVVACRSLYDDFDVDPDKPDVYATREEAFDDVKRYVKALGFRPVITSSGGGFHVYIPMDKDLTPDEWVELSMKKRKMTAHLGLKVDRAVDKDLARVLRPIGVHNRKAKYAEPKPVVLKMEGKANSIDDVRNMLDTYLANNHISLIPDQKGMQAVNPFAAALDYPPVYAEKVAEHCAAMRESFTKKGNVPEQLWWKSVGLLKFCEDGYEKLHEYSEGHPDYDHDETEAKFENWDATGAPTCDSIDELIGCKANCPYADKCNSPISLGQADRWESQHEESVVEEEPEEDSDPKREQKMVDGEYIPFWPDDLVRWEKGALSWKHKDEDGIAHWFAFCMSLVYPINRIKDEEGTWQVQWRAKERNGSWREFNMPTEHLASADLMAKTFAANEIFLHPTKNARGYMMQFGINIIQKLQEYRIETRTYKQLGWVDNFSAFILGNQRIDTKTKQEVCLTDNVHPNFQQDMGVAGTSDQWIENARRYYNRQGAELEQLVLLHVAGSILVEVMQYDNWHGIPLAITGKGGSGKTSAAAFALSLFGRAKYFSNQATDNGFTIAAGLKHIACSGAMPILIDELTNRTMDEIQAIIMALGNGAEKIRLGPNGKFTTVGQTWYKNSIITSNDSIHDEIGKMLNRNKIEATQVRVFEIQVSSDRVEEIFPDLHQTRFMDDHLKEQHGTVGVDYIRYVIKNVERIEKQLGKARDKFASSAAEDSAERFYLNAVATAYVAGKLLEKLGIISFNVENTIKYAISEVKKMRTQRRNTRIDESEYASMFLSSLQGRLIITNRFSHGRGNNKQETPFEKLRQPAVGRTAIEDKKMFVHSSYINEWCKENNVAPKMLKESLAANRYLIQAPDGAATQRVVITSGTTEPGGQARCYELNYQAVYGGDEAPLKVVKPTTEQA